jgi:hypothetical protein
MMDVGGEGMGMRMTAESTDMTEHMEPKDAGLVGFSGCGGRPWILTRTHRHLLPCLLSGMK